MTAIASGLSLCHRIAQRIEQSVGGPRYNMWFDRSARFDYQDPLRRLVVLTPNHIVSAWISRNFKDHIRKAAEEEVGGEVTLDFCVDPSAFAHSAPGRDQAELSSMGRQLPAQPRPARPASETFIATSLRYNLADFVVGPSNELAFSAASRLAEDDPQAAAPLFIHGGVGLGKTHLLQAVCKRFLDQRPQARVLYATGEQFTNEFILAVRTARIEPFRKKIRRLDLLAIDDVHFLASKDKTQQEFLHSFDAIELGGARVVLASDAHPKLINQFSEALVSRCVRGMVVEVRTPDTATRVRIVKALAVRRGLSLTETVVAAVASRCPGSVREIEGSLTKLEAIAMLEGQRHALAPLGHAAFSRAFDGPEAVTASRPPTMDQILAAVVQHTRVSHTDILDHDRQRCKVLARSVTIYLARRLTAMSYPEIAAALGRSSHSMVIAADQRIAQQIAADALVTLPSPGPGDRPAPPETVRLIELVERIKQSAAKH